MYEYDFHLRPSTNNFVITQFCRVTINSNSATKCSDLLFFVFRGFARTLSFTTQRQYAKRISSLFYYRPLSSTRKFRSGFFTIGFFQVSFSEHFYVQMHYAARSYLFGYLSFGVHILQKFIITTHLLPILFLSFKLGCFTHCNNAFTRIVAR